MALGRVLGAEENVDDALGRREVDLSAAERENVGVIVLPAVARQRLVVGRRGEDAGDLVGGHGRADAGAVDEDADPRVARLNGLGDRQRDVGIIHRLRGVRAEVVEPVTEPREVGLDLLLQLEPAVIAADRHGQARLGRRRMDDPHPAARRNLARPRGHDGARRGGDLPAGRYLADVLGGDDVLHVRSRSIRRNPAHASFQAKSVAFGSNAIRKTGSLRTIESSRHPEMLISLENNGVSFVKATARALLY